MNVKWFGAQGDGISDDTDPIQAAIDYLIQNSYGGMLVFPEGVFNVKSVNINITNLNVNNNPIKIVGLGKKITTIKGISNDYDSTVFHVNGKPNLDTYVSFSHLTIKGGEWIDQKGYYGLQPTKYIGIKLELTALFYIDDVEILFCNICIDCEGALVFNVTNFILDFSDIGLKSTYGTFITTDGEGKDVINRIYCNAITLEKGRISRCVNKGIDFGHGSLLTINEVDFEWNGNLMEKEEIVDGELTTIVVGNPNTGGIFIRSDVNGELPTATININNSWFENNKGYTIHTEPNQCTLLSISGSFMLNWFFENDYNQYFWEYNCGVFLNTLGSYGSTNENPIPNGGSIKTTISNCYSNIDFFYIKADKCFVNNSFLSNSSNIELLNNTSNQVEFIGQKINRCIYVDPISGSDENVGFYEQFPIKTFDTALKRISQYQKTTNFITTIFIKAARPVSETVTSEMDAAIKSLDILALENSNVLITSYDSNDAHPKARIYFEGNNEFADIGRIDLLSNVNLYFKNVDLVCNTATAMSVEPTNLCMFGLTNSYAKVIFESNDEMYPVIPSVTGNIFLDLAYFIFQANIKLAMANTPRSLLDVRFLNINIVGGAGLSSNLTGTNSLGVDCVQINSIVPSAYYSLPNTGWQDAVIMRNNF